MKLIGLTVFATGLAVALAVAPAVPIRFLKNLCPTFQNSSLRRPDSPRQGQVIQRFLISLFRIKNNLLNKGVGATFCVVGVHFKRKACYGRRLILFENVFKSILDFTVCCNGWPRDASLDTQIL